VIESRSNLVTITKLWGDFLCFWVCFPMLMEETNGIRDWKPNSPQCLRHRNDFLHWNPLH
jgi:hypothetical protein